MSARSVGRNLTLIVPTRLKNGPHPRVAREKVEEAEKEATGKRQRGSVPSSDKDVTPIGETPHWEQQ